MAVEWIIKKVATGRPPYLWAILGKDSKGYFYYASECNYEAARFELQNYGPGTDFKSGLGFYEGMDMWEYYLGSFRMTVDTKET